MQRNLIYAAYTLFGLGLLMAWFSHGSGVIRNDPARNIFIPDELTIPLQVKSTFNDESIFFRYRWPDPNPNIYHDMLVYEDGKWIRHGNSTVGPEPEGIYEDRLTMLVDDGSVPDFGRYGGYLAIGDGMRFFTKQASKKEVSSHPYLGAEKGKTDVRKYLPETRTENNDWGTVITKEELEKQRAAGYFLDLWHWRAHRSNPIDYSDDQYVAEYRYGDKGKSVYHTNWDEKNKQPKWMYQESKTGFKALQWSDLQGKNLGFDDVYYITDEMSTPFDAQHNWKNGDTLPRRVLRVPEGSRGDISVSGKARWHDGYWDLTLQRKLDTGHPDDDKILINSGLYSAAIAIHRDATGSRWHYVSYPITVGLGREAMLRATKMNTERPDWSGMDWLDLTLFYPGQVSWPFLTSHKHAGAEGIANEIPVRVRHSEEQLATYVVEMEFQDEILRHWWMTIVAGLILVFSLGVALYALTKKEAES